MPAKPQSVSIKTEHKPSGKWYWMEKRQQWGSFYYSFDSGDTWHKKRSDAFNAARDAGKLWEAKERNPMPAKKKPTRRKSTKSPSPAQLRARKAFALAAKARSKAIKKKAGKKPVRQNKTIIKAKRIDHLDVSKVHNPGKTTRRKYRNGYLDLVIMGHAKKTPSGWSLGGKTFKQGKGIVPASKRGYYLDLGTGTVFSKKARNVAQGFFDSNGVFHPIRSSGDYDPGTAGETGRKPVRTRSKKRKTALRKAGQTARLKAETRRRKSTTSRMASRSLSRSAGILKGSGSRRQRKNPIQSKLDYLLEQSAAVRKLLTDAQKDLVHARNAHYVEGSRKTLNDVERIKGNIQYYKGLATDYAERIRAEKRKKNPGTQAEYDAANEAYRKALYEQPRDNAKCLRLAEKVYEIAKDTRLEADALIKMRRHQKRNPSVKTIRKEFAGTLGKATDAFAPIGTPRNVAKLGKLLLIDTENATIKPTGIVYLCADSKGKLHLCGSKNVPIYSGAAQSFGQVKKLEYETAKPHLYPGQGVISFWHKMGEESGNQPTLYADGKGGLKFRGGSYKITREGIVD